MLPGFTRSRAIVPYIGAPFCAYCWAGRYTTSRAVAAQAASGYSMTMTPSSTETG
jgi:hypothetical protein